MSKKDVDYTDPNLNYASDLKKNRFFTKNRQNYINVLSQDQLPPMGNVFLLDVFLSAGNIVEPHYHYNASEVIYCITGETIVSMINPKTGKLMNIKVNPQEAVTIPQGWWHYFQANRDKTHVLTIYDTSNLETIWGSDILRLTPAHVFAHAYGLQQNQVQQALGSIKDRVIIGPPTNRMKMNEQYQTLDHERAVNRYDTRPFPSNFNPNP